MRGNSETAIHEVMLGAMPVAGPELTFESGRGLPVNSDKRWGIVMAGGDGTRLLNLTRLISGDDRPKQFCPLIGHDTLLEQTRKRAEQCISPERLLYPLTRFHRRFYLAETGIRPSQRVVQPANKGTAPPIVYSLLSINRLDSDAIVAILPCDHYYSDDRVFKAALESAFDVASRHSNSVVLLGSPARDPQTDYGWIELGQPVSEDDSNFFRVLNFREKPSAHLALQFFEMGALCNTFIMVGHVRAFLEMLSAARTGLLKAFQGHLWAGVETQIDDWLYEPIHSIDFSRDILSSQAVKLIAMRADQLIWDDLGQPERVMAVLYAAGLEPWWMKEWQATRRPPGSAVRIATTAVA